MVAEGGREREITRSDVHVINFAGLLMHERDDTLEAAIRFALNPSSLVTVSPTPPTAIFEDPEVSIQRAMGQIETEMRKMPNDAPKNVVLVGRSYGGFMLLLAACRLKLSNFLKLVMIEAPLHPEVNVEPAPLIKPLSFLCAKHYAQRPALAREAIAELSIQGTERIVTIGNREDPVVPPASMQLPGKFQMLNLESENLDPVHRRDTTQGVHVILPGHLRGEPNGIFTRLVPEEYVDHLAWSPPKMAFIMQILRATLPQELLVSQAA